MRDAVENIMDEVIAASIGKGRGVEPLINQSPQSANVATRDARLSITPKVIAIDTGSGSSLGAYMTRNSSVVLMVLHQFETRMAISNASPASYGLTLRDSSHHTRRLQISCKLGVELAFMSLDTSVSTNSNPQILLGLCRSSYISALYVHLILAVDTSSTMTTLAVLALDPAAGALGDSFVMDATLVLVLLRIHQKLYVMRLGISKDIIRPKLLRDKPEGSDESWGLLCVQKREKGMV